MNTEADNIIISCENLVKIYKTSEIEVVALQGLDLNINRGEMMAIIGNSGSGKSTLLNMLGGLDRPSAGKLTVDGINLLKLNNQQLVKYKLETVGFVWQNNARNLIPYLTALENIEIPLVLSEKKERREKALQILELVGLAHKRNSKISQLSGGEQQRIAICIGIANSPKILLADEPTGSVDGMTANMILDIFQKLNQSLGITIIIVTHDQKLARKVSRVVAIRDGRTSSEYILKKTYKQELADLENPLSSKDETHVEFAVIDKAGRLQIPKDYLTNLGLNGKNRVRVELEDNKIVILNPDKIEEVNEHE